MLSKLNYPAILTLIVYPVAMGLGAYFYISNYGFGWAEFWMMLAGYYISNITVGVAMHRGWSHGAFKMHKYLEAFFVIISAFTLQGPALVWCSDHYKHHKFTDTDKDPHSPLKFKSKILGFLWSHILWMLVKNNSHHQLDKIAMRKFIKNKMLVWQYRNYLVLVLSTITFIPISIGYLFGGMDLHAAIAGLVFVSIGRALQQHATFCVNSLCHMPIFGHSSYTHATSRDIWWFAPFVLGENYHNFHHAFPKDYRNGWKWHHLDVHKWIIYGLYKLRLVYDLERTSETRISAKTMITNKNVKLEWLGIKEKVDGLMDALHTKIAELEKVNVRNEIHSYLGDIKSKLNDISNKANKLINIPSNSSTELLISCKEKLAFLEKLLKRELSAG